MVGAFSDTATGGDIVPLAAEGPKEDCSGDAVTKQRTHAKPVARVRNHGAGATRRTLGYKPIEEPAQQTIDGGYSRQGIRLSRGPNAELMPSTALSLGQNSNENSRRPIHTDQCSGKGSVLPIVPAYCESREVFLGAGSVAAPTTRPQCGERDASSRDVTDLITLECTAVVNSDVWIVGQSWLERQGCRLASSLTEGEAAYIISPGGTAYRLWREPNHSIWLCGEWTRPGRYEVVDSKKASRRPGLQIDNGATVNVASRGWQKWLVNRGDIFTRPLVGKPFRRGRTMTLGLRD